MGVWCTVSRISVLLDAEEVIRLSRDDGTATVNDTTVSACIMDAEGEFLGAALAGGASPGAASRVAQNWVGVLAIRNLYTRKAATLPEEWGRRVDQAEKFLGKLYDGKARIDEQDRREGTYGVAFNDDYEGNDWMDY